MLPKRQWIEMTWEDFRAGDPARWIAVLPVAAVEQHGPHLPVGVDGYIAEGYLARVQRHLPDALPVTFLPLQWIGKSDEHLDYPGTLTLSAESALRAWAGIGKRVHRAGVRKLVIVNAHGGNSALLELVARELRVQFGVLVATASWSRFGYPEGLFGEAERVHGIHGGAIETSLMLALRPDLVRMEKAADFQSATLAMEKEFKWLRADRPAGFGWMTQDLNPAGAVGDARAASKEKGEAALEHGARAFIELLQDVDRFDLKRLQPGPLG
ncbi:MAG: creatininase family protein [Bradyrhizobiaceae bacterium]|nr:creatininase family protein [Bradyrhizobiaceae bacterium]